MVSTPNPQLRTSHSARTGSARALAESLGRDGAYRIFRHRDDLYRASVRVSGRAEVPRSDAVPAHGWVVTSRRPHLRIGVAPDPGAELAVRVRPRGSYGRQQATDRRRRGRINRFSGGAAVGVGLCRGVRRTCRGGVRVRGPCADRRRVDDAGGGARPDSRERELRKAVDETCAELATGIPVERRVVRQDAVRALLDEARDSDLLVVGRRGHGRFAQVCSDR